MTDITTIGVEIDGRGAKKGAQQVKAAFNDIRSSGNKVTAGLKGIQSAVFSLKGAFAGLSIGLVTRELVDTAKQLNATERGLKLVTGSAEGATAEMAFLKDVANGLAINLEAAESAFVKVAASAKGTSLEGQSVREVFLGISQASAALGLSADQTNGALVAVSQIISKGKVSAEELRQQLGERLPGAFQIAARSIGVTTEELDDMLKAGSLLAEDFIPLFAAQLQKEFGETAASAVDTLGGKLALLENAGLELKRTIATSGILDPLIDAAIELTEVFSDPEFLATAAEYAKALGEAISFTADNFDLLAKAAAAVLAVRLGAPLVEMAKGVGSMGKAAVVTTSGLTGLEKAMVAARVQTIAMTAAARAGAVALGALKAALPYAAVFLAVDALTAWAFSADEAETAAADLKTRVDQLATSYKNLTGARLEAAILDVKDQIKNLEDASRTSEAVVETLAKQRLRSDESLEQRNAALTRARAEAQRATEELAEAEQLLAKLQSQAAGNADEIAEATKKSADAKLKAAQANLALKSTQEDARAALSDLAADLREQVDTFDAGTAAQLRYRLESGDLKAAVATLGDEGNALKEIILQLGGTLDGLEASSKKGKAGLSETQKEMQRAREEAQGLITDLEDQIATLGLSAAEVDLYRVSMGDLADVFDKLPDGAEIGQRFVTLSAELRKAEEHQERLRDAQEDWTSLLSSTEQPIDTLTRQLGELYTMEQNLSEIADELGIDQEILASRIARAAEAAQEGYDKAVEAANKGTEEMSQAAIAAARSIQGAFSDLFFDVMQGEFDGLADRFKSTLDRMVADLISSQLLEFAGQQFGIPGLSGSKGGSGGADPFGAIFSGISSWFAGGAATGNEWTVPGSGGHDSTMMLAKVTPGESVKVQTPYQKEMEGRTGMGGDTISVSMNITTPDVGGFMASRSQIENQLLEAVQRGRRNA